MAQLGKRRGTAAQHGAVWRGRGGTGLTLHARHLHQAAANVPDQRHKSGVPAARVLLCRPRGRGTQ